MKKYLILLFYLTLFLYSTTSLAVGGPKGKFNLFVGLSETLWPGTVRVGINNYEFGVLHFWHLAVGGQKLFRKDIFYSGMGLAFTGIGAQWIDLVGTVGFEVAPFGRTFTLRGELIGFGNASGDSYGGVNVGIGFSL